MPARFEFFETGLPGAPVIERSPLSDARGYLERLYCDDELRPILGDRTIRQVNRTVTRAKGAVRGLHFQRQPSAEMKLVQCLSGTVFDIAVDLRSESPTFGRWHGVELSGAAHRTFVIPEGFAHGFQTLTTECQMLYFHTSPYDPRNEGGLNPLDPELGIIWPLPITEISGRDRSHPGLNAAFEAL